MLISCEKCSTTYVLDDALIPAGGAPVQCTRCGNVFTAKPGAEPTPSANPNQTMMFGAAGGGAPAPAPAPVTSRAASQTMVFGSSPFAGAAAPAAPAAGGVLSTTMMFGTPAANAAAAAAAAAPPPPKPNQTMVFGSKAPAAPAPPPTFGPPQSQGASPQGGSGAPPNPSQTMMFGLNPAGAPVPVARPAASTAMFGAVAPAAPSPAKPPNTTMMFGKATGAPALAPAPSPAAAAVGRSTMIFGAADVAKLPKVTPGTAVPVTQITESTVRVDVDAMMRERADQGQQQAPSGAPGDRHNRTQLFALNDARSGEKTPPEAFPSPLAGAEAQLDTPPPSDSAPAPGVRHERTQLFSMTAKPTGNAPAQREMATDITMPPDAAMRHTMMFGAQNNADTAPGLPGVTPDLLKTPIGSPATTAPNLSSDFGSRDVHSSSETSESEPSLDQVGEHSPSSSQDLAPTSEDSGDQEQAFAAIESSTRRRNTIAVIVLLLAVLTACAAVAWQVVIRQMVTQEGAQKVPNPLPKTTPPIEPPHK